MLLTGDTEAQREARRDRSVGEWSVYVVECGDGSLYTGIAKSVERRLATHNRGRGAKYTRARLPVRLLHAEAGLSHGDALRRERTIKSLSRRRKLALVDRPAGLET